MLGRKTSTLPTPPITPSTIMSFSHPSFMADAVKEPNPSTIHSIQRIGYSPMTNVPSKTTYRRRKKIGNASHLFVTTASILSVMFLFFLRAVPVEYVSARAPWTNAYLASTMADSIPEPRMPLILPFSSKRAEMISSLFSRDSTTFSISLSFSRYFIARKRVEYLYRMSSVLDMSSLMRAMLCSSSAP